MRIGGTVSALRLCRGRRRQTVAQLGLDARALARLGAERKRAAPLELRFALPSGTPIGVAQMVVDDGVGRLQLDAIGSASVPFSLGWAARENDESLEQTIHRADKKLLAVRVIDRTEDRTHRRSGELG